MFFRIELFDFLACCRLEAALLVVEKSSGRGPFCLGQVDTLSLPASQGWSKDDPVVVESGDMLPWRKGFDRLPFTFWPICCL